MWGGIFLIIFPNLWATCCVVLGEHLAPYCAYEMWKSSAASPEFCYFSVIWDNTCPLLPQGTGMDLADCRIWELVGTGQRIWGKVINWSWMLDSFAFFYGHWKQACLLCWFLPPDQLSRFFIWALKTRWALLQLICDVQGTVYVLSKAERRPYCPVLAFFFLWGHGWRIIVGAWPLLFHTPGFLSNSCFMCKSLLYRSRGQKYLEGVSS